LKSNLRESVLNTTSRIDEWKHGPERSARLWRALPAAAAALLAIGAIAIFLLRNASPNPALQAPPDGKDAQGAPLPSGATGRLGTLRLRHPCRVRHLAFSPDGKTLASGAMDGKVRLWDVGSGDDRLALPGCPNGAALGFTADGLNLVIAGMDGTTVWEVRGPKDFAKLSSFEAYANSVAFFPDGKSLVTGSTQRTASIWETATGKQTFEFKEHRGQLHCVAVSPDGKMVASGEEFSDNTILLWDPSTGQVLHKLKGHKGQAVHALSFSPDGKMLASSGHDGKILVWDPSTGKKLFDVRGNEAIFSQDGRLLAIASGGQENTKVRIWDVAQQADLRALPGSLHVTWCGPLAFSPDGKLLAAGDDTSIFLWDVASGRRLFDSPDPSGFAQSLAFLPGDKILACGYTDGTIRFWDTSSQTEILPAATGQGAIYSIALSRDGSVLASASSAKAIRFWDPRSGKNTGSLPAALGSTLIAVSPDGKRVAFSEPDPKDQNRGILHLREVSSGKDLWTLPLASVGFGALSFSPDGKTLSTQLPIFTGGGWQGSRLSVVDAAAGQRIAESESPLPLQSSQRAAFSPDGQIVAVCGSGGGQTGVDLSLLDATSGREIVTFKGEGLDEVAAMAFSPGGRYLAVGEGRRYRARDAARRQATRIEVWEVATGTRTGAFEGHTGLIHSLAFSRGGRTLASGSDDTTVLLWDLLPEAAPKSAPADLGRLWEDLGNVDSALARLALGALVGCGDRTAKFLVERLLAASNAPAELGRWIEDLASGDTVTHLKAAKRIRESLAQPGTEGALRKALDANPPEPARTRLEEMLGLAERPSLVKTPETLRQLRAIEVLEKIGSEAARDALRLVASSGRARIARQAAAALERSALERGVK
jgi:WD40 repeat protein